MHECTKGESLTIAFGLETLDRECIDVWYKYGMLHFNLKSIDCYVINVSVRTTVFQMRNLNKMRFFYCPLTSICLLLTSICFTEKV